MYADDDDEAEKHAINATIYLSIEHCDGRSPGLMVLNLNKYCDDE